jgi:hypothetical protein
MTETLLIILKYSLLFTHEVCSIMETILKPALLLISIPLILSLPFLPIVFAYVLLKDKSK